MARFLWSPRWAIGHVLVLLVAVLFVRLGLWQLDRLDERRAGNRLIERREALPPAPVADVLGPSTEPETVAYRRVEAEGTYDAAREVILFGRTLEGEPGNHVLTPLVLADGRAVIVDRGWVPIEMDDPPIEGAPPPSGNVRATGVLFAPESADASGGPTNSIGKIDIERLRGQLPYEVLPLYVWLKDQEPPQPGDLPVVVPLPELTQGPHLGYAVQWFAFAAIAAVGWVVLLRKEDRERAAGGPRRAFDPADPGLRRSDRSEGR